MNPKDILIKPIITEKSLEIVKSQNGYTFQVDRRAAKPQIARAVEQFFNVKVQNIRTITTPGRLRRQLKKTPNLPHSRRQKSHRPTGKRSNH